jgi:hypothetical protein
MVARINTRKSISKALNYNESKVRAGVGEILLSSGFGCDITDLNFYEKLRRFELLNKRNEDIKTNTLHISLNFPPEDYLTPELLQRLALDYMDRIGFGEQPFLVYQHHDANHPHIHIVTSCIRPDGNPIDLHNIGRELSEPARESLEEEYGLTRARGRQKHLQQPDGSPDLASKVQELTNSYRFTSLDELNAILAQFGMIAWDGTPGSALRNNRGLVYSRIDETGNKIGVPIKSSDLATRPTLNWLEKRFEVNKVRKLAVRERSTQKLAGAITAAGPTGLAQQLKNRKISIQADRDVDGNLCTLRLIDHANKAVFTPEDLGFSSNILATRLAVSNLDIHKSRPTEKKAKVKAAASRRSKTTGFPLTSHIQQILLGKTRAPGAAGDYPIKKKKKKRKPY